MSPNEESSPSPKIEYLKKYFPEGFKLDEHYEAVLRKLFSEYYKIMVVSEFGSGLSVGLVFRIQPSDKQGKEPVPAVAKLGSFWLTEREFQAYNRYIKDFLPREIGIIRFESIKDKDVVWGGLRYALAGQGIAEFQDLETYFKDYEVDNIRKMLKGDLFKALGRLYREPTKKLASYDRILPVNLVIKAVAVDSEAPNNDKVPEITPENIDVELHPGMAVRVCRFMITEIDNKGEEFTVTLNRPSVESSPETSFRIRIKLQSMHDLALQNGSIIPLVEGVIETTRRASLDEEASKALRESHLQLLDTTIRFGDGRELPNPLFRMEHILDGLLRRPVWVGGIHGDLNLQNVLADPEHNIISIIDFALSREDHLLHDFLRLETEVVTKIISAIISQHEKLSPELIEPFYVNLYNICARNMEPYKSAWLTPELEKPFKILMEIRKAAQVCFYPPKDEEVVEEDKGFFLIPGDWTEYNEYLALYLLGALKFKNLDKESKKLALLGAATLLDLADTIDTVQNNDRVKVTPLAQAFRDFGIQILHVRSGEKKRIEVNGSGKTRAAYITVSELGTLTLRTWIKEPEEGDRNEHWYKYELEIQSSHTLNNYPYAPHKWKFERLIGLEQKFVINDKHALLLEYNRLNRPFADVWWLRHKRHGQSETRIFIFVEKAQI
jgi:serine/threonine protein kinase